MQVLLLIVTMSVVLASTIVGRTAAESCNNLTAHSLFNYWHVSRISQLVKKIRTKFALVKSAVLCHKGTDVARGTACFDIGRRDDFVEEFRVQQWQEWRSFIHLHNVVDTKAL